MGRGAWSCLQTMMIISAALHASVDQSSRTCDTSLIAFSIHSVLKKRTQTSVLATKHMNQDMVYDQDMMFALSHCIRCTGK